MAQEEENNGLPSRGMWQSHRRSVVQWLFKIYEVGRDAADLWTSSLALFWFHTQGDLTQCFSILCCWEAHSAAILFLQSLSTHRVLLLCKPCPQIYTLSSPPSLPPSLLPSVRSSYLRYLKLKYLQSGFSKPHSARKVRNFWKLLNNSRKIVGLHWAPASSYLRVTNGPREMQCYQHSCAWRFS